MTVVCITGMHRSGTSLVARMLNLCGVFLGDEQDMLPPAADNPEGFWEHTHFFEINQRVLAKLGGTWYSPPSLEGEWFKQPNLASERSDAAALIAQMSASGTWGWKDPRNSLTLPFWQQLASPMKVVVCLRNPIEVANSLSARDGLTFDAALALWHTYYHALMSSTLPSDRIVTHYRSYFHDARAELRRLLHFLHLEPSDPVFESACATVKLVLRHHQHDVRALLSAGPTTAALNLYADLCADAGETYWQSVRATPADSADAHATGGSALEADLLRRLASRDPSTEVLVSELEDHHRRLEETQGLLQAAEARAASTRAAELEHQVDELSVRLAESASIAQGLTTRLKSVEQDLDRRTTEAGQLQHAAEASAQQASMSERRAHDLDSELREIKISKAWRLAMFLRRLRVAVLPPGSWASTTAHQLLQAARIWRRDGPAALVHRLATRLHLPLNAFGAPLDDYGKWMLNNEPSAAELDRQRFEAGSMQSPPLISIILPVHGVPTRVLHDAIQSVQRQTYPHWELCIANGSPQSREIGAMLHRHSAADQRIKVIALKDNLGIAANSNAAIALATGDFVTFLDQDDLLAPSALFEVSQALQRYPDADMLYTDEDLLTADGRARYGPHFKPAYSPDLLRSINYITHLLVVRRNLGRALGWLREGYDGAQDYDLVLRVSERARQIVHIPKVLYHWRHWPSSSTNTPGSPTDAKVLANERGKRALTEHLERSGERASVLDGPDLTTYQVRYALPSRPLVSIIIPNRDHAEDLRRCVTSIRSMTAYDNYEIVIVENSSREPRTHALYDELRDDLKVRVINYAQPFNFSKINNFAAHQAAGEVLLFLNNDVVPGSADWLERMLEHALRPEVGVVGAKLLYPSGSIQHAGIVLGIGNYAGHSHKHSPGDAPGYVNRLRLIQNYSAVTGACLMIRRECFQEVGGFNEGYELAVSDVDLCLLVASKGYRIVWTPYSVLTHYESATRGYEDTELKRARFARERDRFRYTWSRALEAGDSFYNPNLTLISEDFRISPASAPALPRTCSVGLFAPRTIVSVDTPPVPLESERDLGTPSRTDSEQGQRHHSSIQHAQPRRARFVYRDERQRKMLACIDPRSQDGLEIGPLYTPVLSKADAGGRIWYVDHADTDALKDKYKDHINVPKDQIVPVDYVWGDSTLSQLVGGRTFDYVLAAHVMEHVPDVIGWLAEVAEVLTDGGILSLALPDKRFSFDYMRELTTGGMLVDAWLLRRRRPSPRDVFDHYSMARVVEMAAAWAGPLDRARLQPYHDLKQALHEARRALSDPEYQDVHVSTFTPQSFLDLFEMLARLELHEFAIADYHDTAPGTLEFYVALSRLPRDRSAVDALRQQLESSVRARVQLAATTRTG